MGERIKSKKRKGKSTTLKVSREEFEIARFRQIQGKAGEGHRKGKHTRKKKATWERKEGNSPRRVQEKSLKKKVAEDVDFIGDQSETAFLKRNHLWGEKGTAIHSHELGEIAPRREIASSGESSRDYNTDGGYQFHFEQKEAPK